MCVYSMVGDEFFKQPTPPIWPYPPFIPDAIPLPLPTIPPAPDWKGFTIKQLRDLLAALELIRKVEGINCPCEREKVDYIGILQREIAEREKQEAAELALRHHDPATCQACKCA